MMWEWKGQIKTPCSMCILIGQTFNPRKYNAAEISIVALHLYEIHNVDIIGNVVEK